MMRFRRFAIAALAAGTIVAGSLAHPPTASALPISCSLAKALASMYRGTGTAYATAGNYAAAIFWYGKADAVMELSAC